MPPTGATCTGVLLETTFIDWNDMYLQKDSRQGLWSPSALTTKLRRHNEKHASHQSHKRCIYKYTL